MSILLAPPPRGPLPEPVRRSAPSAGSAASPGTYEWIPFGGGIRRCLGAALAMAEQRVVLAAMARRLDLEAAEPEPEQRRAPQRHDDPGARRPGRRSAPPLSRKPSN